MQETFDKLYEQSEKKNIFDELFPTIMSDNNIRLAYRNIKNNSGSHTAGTNGKTIKYISNLNMENWLNRVKWQFHNYISSSVRRVFIPKPNGKQRPLGIPNIDDRILGQAILQVLEPICEAKFHRNSNGFRPNKDCERAISQLTNRIFRNKCYYVVDVDIKSFFDNVNHNKLIRQLWTLGIRDKKLLVIISKMLKAEIVGEGIPTKGTPQGGIISPLLSNVVLNELDWWLSNQWETYYPKDKIFKTYKGHNGGEISNRYPWLRKNTKLKEFYFVRYADDFKIICKSYEDAVKLKIAVTSWLKTRLHLEVSEEKTKIINLKKSYSEFLGFKIKVRKKSNGKMKDRYTIVSHTSDKARNKIENNLNKQIKAISKDVNNCKKTIKNIKLYDSIVMGIHNYYHHATSIAMDMSGICSKFRIRLYKIFGTLIQWEISGGQEYLKRYRESKQLYSVYGIPVIPSSYVKFKVPTSKSNLINKYTKSGRNKIHSNIDCLSEITIKQIISHPIRDGTVELNDVIIPRLCSQYGKCFISGIKINFDNIDYIYADKNCTDRDSYNNVRVIDKSVKQFIVRERRDIKNMKSKEMMKEIKNGGERSTIGL